MSRKQESVYKDAGYWWWRDPATGALHGAFTKRSEAREFRKRTMANRGDQATESQAEASANTTKDKNNQSAAA